MKLKIIIILALSNISTVGFAMHLPSAVASQDHRINISLLIDQGILKAY